MWRNGDAPAENPQRATMQTPQGLDAKHRDELFPVKPRVHRYKLRSAKGLLERLKISPLHTSKPRAIFKFGIRNFVFGRCADKPSSRHLVEQRPRFLQIARIEPLSEPNPKLRALAAARAALVSHKWAVRSKEQCLCG
jgi:hypothetical protein